MAWRISWPHLSFGPKNSFGQNLAKRIFRSKRNRVPRDKVQVQWLAKWKCRPSAISRHQMSAKYKGWLSGNEGQVQKVAKCYYDKFVFKMAKWINGQMQSAAKGINGQMQSVAKWKKWPSAKMVKFVFKMAKWINGQMQWVNKCKNDRICPKSGQVTE